MPRFSIALMLLLLATSAFAAAEPAERVGACYVRIAHAEDDELKFDRPREITGFNCGAYKVAGGDVDGIIDLSVSYNHSDAITGLKGDGNFTGKGMLPGELRLRDGKWTLHRVH